ncbi:MAG TPA: hypothetical protein VF799_00755 [Geobacteraceae bacterium]
MEQSEKIREIKERLEATDLLMVRIIEDLIRVLAQRGFVKYSDFCDESRELLQEREKLRMLLRPLLQEDGDNKQTT